MKSWKELPAYPAWIALLLSTFLAAALPAKAQQATVSNASLDSTTQLVVDQQRANLDGLPDSPGAVRAGLQEAESRQSNIAQSSAPASAAGQTATSPEPQQSQTSVPSPPVGTAAAGPLRFSGVAASQPAGVAIAPAKQRRVRTIVIRVGAILAAGAAVGTVVALTEATSSKPPGAK
jgi:biotin carboxyl carrier protein